MRSWFSRERLYPHLRFAQVRPNGDVNDIMRSNPDSRCPGPLIPRRRRGLRSRITTIDTFFDSEQPKVARVRLW
jgi:hypothetical protein